MSTNYTLNEALYSSLSRLVKKECNSEPLYLSIIFSQEGRSSSSPRLGLIFLVKTCKAVVFPIPLVPTSPSMEPFLGMGSLCKTNLLAPNLWETWSGRSVGRFIILIASKGHFLTQRLHPIQRTSLMTANGSDLST